MDGSGVPLAAGGTHARCAHAQETYTTVARYPVFTAWGDVLSLDILFIVVRACGTQFKGLRSTDDLRGQVKHLQRAA